MKFNKIKNYLANFKQRHYFKRFKGVIAKIIDAIGNIDMLYIAIPIIFLTFIKGYSNTSIFFSAIASTFLYKRVMKDIRRVKR